MSSRRRAGAPPAVADQTASSGVIPMSRTARAMQKGTEEVKEEPGLQSVDRATVTPASRRRRAAGGGGGGPGLPPGDGAPAPPAPRRRRASGHSARVENSAPGSSVATV